MSCTPADTGQAPASSRFRAPARVNIIGEHTDYNDGFVLPTTTALFTTVTASPECTRIIRVTSANLQETREFDLDDIEPGDAPLWIDYAKGVAAEIEAAGVHLPGATLEVDSAIPLGGGLSSSASFEMAIAIALIDLAGATLSGPEIAKLCQRAENRYAGVACGIMDPFSVACCERGNAMLLDCRSLDVRQVALPQDAGMLLTHSGVRHRLPDSGYNNRADECAAAVALIAQAAPEVVALRDLTCKMLADWRDRLGETLYRRCRHVVSENQRVHDAFAALKAGDLEQLGLLVAASHASLRDDYEVSCNEVDQLVGIADDTEGVAGSRMVGAGFGGCVLSIVHAAKIEAAAHYIRQQYTQVSGVAPWMHIVQAASPAREIKPDE